MLGRGGFDGSVFGASRGLDGCDGTGWVGSVLVGEGLYWGCTPDPAWVEGASVEHRCQVHRARSSSKNVYKVGQIARLYAAGRMERRLPAQHQVVVIVADRRTTET